MRRAVPKNKKQAKQAMAYIEWAMPTLKGRAVPKIYEKGCAQNKG